MKILQVGSSLRDWGGIERFLCYLTEGLTDRGHEVWTTVAPGAPMEGRIQGHQAKIGLYSQFDFARIPAYLRLFRRHRFDVVNVHFSPDYIIPAVAARIARQGNLILTRHVALPWKPSRVRRYTRLYDGFIAVSEAVKDKLVESGIPEKDLLVAKAGIPALAPTISMDAMREQLAISQFAVGFFGRIVADKGVQTLIKAAPSLPPETFQVFGDGPLLTDYRTSVKGVRFHGRVEDVANAMNAMDVVAVPSLWDEALGLSALEAMSLGKPVIATRSGGLAELIQDGETGFLFEKGDAGKLVELVHRLQGDPDLGRRLGDAGNSLHREEYTVAKMAERAENAYLTFLNRS